MTHVSQHDPENDRPTSPSSTGASQQPPERDLPTAGADPLSRGSAPDFGPASGAGAGPAVKDAAVAGAGKVKDAALAGAGEVSEVAMERGGDVARAARDELTQLTAEARHQAMSLWSQASEQLREQAVNGKQQAADLLHSLAGELGHMASRSEQDGPLTAVAKQVAARAGELSHWLQEAEPSDVLAEIRRFARRRPVVFLAGAALAGVVVGRLSRGMMAAADEHHPAKAMAPTRSRVPSSAVAEESTPAGAPARASQDFSDDTAFPNPTPLSAPGLGSAARWPGDAAGGDWR
jgi:hypothetical protein